MKRPRCKQCKHTMKGHKKQRCEASKIIFFQNGSKYEGTVYDNKPSGHGTFTSPNSTYTGHWIDGKRHGIGSEKWTDGRFYEGDWRSGLFHGHGTMASLSGSMYRGGFHTGTYHGPGTIQHAHSSYQGQWNHGTYHGQGIHTTSQGVYNGQFYYNIRHGDGTFTDSKGNIFSGKWRKGEKTGPGVYTDEDGTYTGSWHHNLQSGRGIWVSKRHGMYVGDWKRGKRHRRGVHTYNDGTIYDGGWSKGVKTGHGTLTWTCGDCYKGFWLHDKYNGRGTLTIGTTTFTGEWEMGQREGVFREKKDGIELEGPWVNDGRHGTFSNGTLYIWNTPVVFKTLSKARTAAVNMTKEQDYEGARVVLEHCPKLLTWSFFWKHDKRGVLLHLWSRDKIINLLQTYSWKLFQAKRYIFLEQLMTQLPDQLMIVEAVPELFDALSKDFVPNPWMVHTQSYSEETKRKLLEGIHVGECGRCSPRDPYTRLPLTEDSGTYLATDKKKAKALYTLFMASIDKRPGIREIARSFDIEDFEECLKNAREAKDIDTIKRVMKERNDYCRSGL